MNDMTIINKMISELKLAKEKGHSRQEIMPHIGHVKLLCELFLEDTTKSASTQPASNSSFTEQEIKVMLGETKKEKPQSKVNHDEANGDSIFDF